MSGNLWKDNRENRHKIALLELLVWLVSYAVGAYFFGVWGLFIGTCLGALLTHYFDF